MTFKQRQRLSLFSKQLIKKTTKCCSFSIISPSHKHSSAKSCVRLSFLPGQFLSFLSRKLRELLSLFFWAICSIGIRRFVNFQNMTFKWPKCFQNDIEKLCIEKINLVSLYYLKNLFQFSAVSSTPRTYVRFPFACIRLFSKTQLLRKVSVIVFFSILLKRIPDF